MTPEIIAEIVVQALSAAGRAYQAFEGVHGRPPTVEEWRALQSAWKSPEEIEAEVKARLAGGGGGR